MVAAGAAHGSPMTLDPSIPPSLTPVFLQLYKGNVPAAKKMLLSVLQFGPRNGDTVEKMTLAIANMLLGEIAVREQDFMGSLKRLENACPELDLLSVHEGLTMRRRTESCYRLLHVSYSSLGRSADASRVADIVSGLQSRIQDEIARMQDVPQSGNAPPSSAAGSPNFNQLTRVVEAYVACGKDRLCTAGSMGLLETWDHESDLKPLARYTARILKRAEAASGKKAKMPLSLKYLKEETDRVKGLSHSTNVNEAKLKEFKDRAAVLRFTHGIVARYEQKVHIELETPQTFPLARLWAATDAFLQWPVLFLTPGKLAVGIVTLLTAAAIVHVMVLAGKKKKRSMKKAKGKMPSALQGYESVEVEAKPPREDEKKRAVRHRASAPAVQVATSAPPMPPKRSMSSRAEFISSRRISRRSRAMSRKTSRVRADRNSPSPLPRLPVTSIQIGSTPGIPKSESEENLLHLLGQLKKQKRSSSKSKGSPTSVVQFGRKSPSSCSEESSSPPPPPLASRKKNAVKKSHKVLFEKSTGSKKRKGSRNRKDRNMNIRTAVQSIKPLEVPAVSPASVAVESAWNKKLLVDVKKEAVEMPEDAVQISENLDSATKKIERTISVDSADSVSSSAPVPPPYPCPVMYVQAYGFDPATGIPILIPGVQVPLPAPVPLVGPPAPLNHWPVACTVEQAAVAQIEYYFSPQNLQRDAYLQGLMDEEGWVGLDQICQFKRMKAIGLGDEAVLDALFSLGSSIVQVEAASGEDASQGNVGWVRSAVTAQN